MGDLGHSDVNLFELREGDGSAVVTGLQCSLVFSLVGFLEVLLQASVSAEGPIAVGTVVVGVVIVASAVAPGMLVQAVPGPVGFAASRASEVVDSLFLFHLLVEVEQSRGGKQGGRVPAGRWPEF